jgi:hypothetical protein
MRVIRAGMTTGCILFVFEAAMGVVSPTKSTWTSHTISILFTTLVAAAVMFVALKKELRGQLCQPDVQPPFLFDSNPLPICEFDSKSLKFLAAYEPTSQYECASRDFLSMTIADIRPEETIPDLFQATTESVRGHQETTTWRGRKNDGINQ